MRSKLAASSPFARKFRVTLYAFALAAPLASAACGSEGNKDGTTAASGIIIVNAPAAGEVRRVLVREGMSVNEGTPIVEIAVRTEARNNTPRPEQADDPVVRAGKNVGVAQAKIEAARAEAVRAEVEVQRLTPLVAAGDAPQAQLDGARAEYERAQRRLQEAQSAAENAQSGLVAARQQPPRNPTNAAAAAVTPSEQLVMAQATSSGTVSVVNARVGDRVTAGQSLATLRAEQ